MLPTPEASRLIPLSIRSDSNGGSVSVPPLPGCLSHGETEAEAIANIKTAIGEYSSVWEEQFDDADVQEVIVTA